MALLPPGEEGRGYSQLSMKWCRPQAMYEDTAATCLFLTEIRLHDCCFLFTSGVYELSCVFQKNIWEETIGGAIISLH